jgi:hypothetical protein
LPILQEIVGLNNLKGTFFVRSSLNLKTNTHFTFSMKKLIVSNLLIPKGTICLHITLVQ